MKQNMAKQLDFFSKNFPITVLDVVILRFMMMQRLDGMTGDTIGATVEIVEVCALIGLIL